MRVHAAAIAGVNGTAVDGALGVVAGRMLETLLTDGGRERHSAVAAIATEGGNGTGRAGVPCGEAGITAAVSIGPVAPALLVERNAFARALLLVRRLLLGAGNGWWRQIGHFITCAAQGLLGVWKMWRLG